MRDQCGATLTLEDKGGTGGHGFSLRESVFGTPVCFVSGSLNDPILGNLEIFPRVKSSLFDLAEG